MSPISLTVTGSEWPGDRAKVTQLCPVPVCYVTNARSVHPGESARHTPPAPGSLRWARRVPAKCPHTP